MTRIRLLPPASLTGAVRAAAFAVSLAMACLGVASPDRAQAEVPAFKTVNIIIGYAPGGTYDLYGRAVARHLGRFLPGNPRVVPQNMPGAGSLKAAGFLYNVSPKDGTALGVLVETLGLEQALRNPGVQYDAAKFNWIGRIASSNNVQVVWHSAKAQSIGDVKVHETTVGGTGAGNIAETVPKLLNAVIGTKFKVISGYSGSPQAMLAMESGEIDGVTAAWGTLKASKQIWFKENQAKIILQDVLERDPDLPDVPAIVELASNADDRKLLALYASGGVVGRAIVAPPGLSSEVTQTLRTALDRMVADPEFLTDLNRMVLDVAPLPGDKLQAVVADSVTISDELRQRALGIFGR
jgi:tripartite-type tricarboxylate transporter receptor subunit TctC